MKNNVSLNPTFLDKISKEQNLIIKADINEKDQKKLLDMIFLQANLLQSYAFLKESLDGKFFNKFLQKKSKVNELEKKAENIKDYLEGFSEEYLKKMTDVLEYLEKNADPVTKLSLPRISLRIAEFNKNNIETFLISKEVFDNLKNLPLCNIKKEHIPQGRTVQICFNDSFEYDIWIKTEKDLISINFFHKNKILDNFFQYDFVYSNHSDNNFEEIFNDIAKEGMISMSNKFKDIDEFKDISKSFKEIAEKDTFIEECQECKDFIKMALNMFLYIVYGNPDTRVFKTKPLCNRRPDKQRKFWKRNSSLPFTFIDMEYLKERIFNRSDSKVRGHYRWQPYGKNREAIKLIWINPFVRNYKNTHTIQESIR